MIAREAAVALKRLQKGYPVIALIGPRQSGKTTLAQYAFGSKPYVSLEDPHTLEFATTDPVGFLAQYPDGAILDEIQRQPALLSYIQGIVDRRRMMGQFVLTGSQQLQLSAGISQSLAGRVAIIELLPFSYQEIAKSPAAEISLQQLLFQGGYPPIYDRAVRPWDWYADYVKTYVERDVRQILNISDLIGFQRFIRLCAARTAQVVNYSDLGADAGIDQKTVKSWLSVLEASFILHRVHPYHENFSKRLVKSAKIYFTDTGLGSHLVGIRSPEDLSIHSMRGQIFESWVASEILKRLRNQHDFRHLYFWRDHKGKEVDFILEQAGHFLAIECKSGQTLADSHFDNLRYLKDLAKTRVLETVLVYGGNESQKRSIAKVLAWNDLASLPLSF